MMGDGVEFKLTGIDNLLSKLDTISDDMKNKGGRSALRKAANIVRDKARTNAQKVDNPLTKEAIYKNITARWNNRNFRRTGDLSFRVGVIGGAKAPLSDQEKRKTDLRRKRKNQTSLSDLGEFSGAGKNNPGGDTFYWRFLEFGTQKMRAQPILRPALNGANSDVVNAFITEYEKAIDRAIARAQQKGGSS